ncbi:MAG: alanine/glycine:cation symporter family protein [Hyphomonadaceae bacterium]
MEYQPSILDHVTNVADFVWGGTWTTFTPEGAQTAQVLPFPPMVILLFGVGLMFMVRLKFYPILKLPAAFAGLFKKSTEGDGEISPFAALSTALSGQVGTGNLAGVATAITLGGPGAIFWMWVTAIIGMALAFAEGSLAIRFRDVDEHGHYRGGPMTYIRRGLGKNWGWLAILFCVGTLISSLSTGNMIQANGMADAITGLFPLKDVGAGIDSSMQFDAGTGGEMIAGLIVAALVFIVIIGGIKSIGSVAEKIVPSMALAYIVMALIAIGLNFRDIPVAFAEIFGAAFTGQAATGGFVGASIMLAIRAGVARGLFSNEAGQGSTPMAHAAARTNDPAQQGRFAMMGTFIDTIVICTMTALVILTVQGSFTHTTEGVASTVDFAWQSDLSGFDLTSAAYGTAFPLEIVGGVALGQLVASIALILFAFTTLITWGYYGERAVSYLIGGRSFLAIPWRIVWCLFIFVGAFLKIELVWPAGDIANAIMAVPNLIALFMLSGVVVKLAQGDRTAGKDHTD